MVGDQLAVEKHGLGEYKALLRDTARGQISPPNHTQDGQSAVWPLPRRSRQRVRPVSMW
jgi:hypothetical protein